MMSALTHFAETVGCKTRFSRSKRSWNCCSTTTGKREKSINYPLTGEERFNRIKALLDRTGIPDRPALDHGQFSSPCLYQELRWCRRSTLFSFFCHGLQGSCNSRRDKDIMINRYRFTDTTDTIAFPDYISCLGERVKHVFFRPVKCRGRRTPFDHITGLFQKSFLVVAAGYRLTWCQQVPAPVQRTVEGRF